MSSDVNLMSGHEITITTNPSVRVITDTLHRQFMQLYLTTYQVLQYMV